MNATCQTEAGEPRPCGVMAAIDRSEYYRRRKENSTLKKDSTLKKETEKGKEKFPPRTPI